MQMSRHLNFWKSTTSKRKYGRALLEDVHSNILVAKVESQCPSPANQAGSINEFRLNNVQHAGVDLDVQNGVNGLQRGLKRGIKLGLEWGGPNGDTNGGSNVMLERGSIMGLDGAPSNMQQWVRTGARTGLQRGIQVGLKCGLERGLNGGSKRTLNQD